MNIKKQVLKYIDVKIQIDLSVLKFTFHDENLIIFKSKKQINIAENYCESTCSLPSSAPKVLIKINTE